MEPLYRVEVNRTGFCKEHFKRLSNGGNKLGLTLEAITRTEYLEKNLPQPKNAKAAARAADTIIKAVSGCVICDSIDKSMRLYLETVAAMYAAERDFPAAFRASGGFCASHYAELLRFSRCAGKAAADFLRAVEETFFTGLGSAKADADAFAQKFDACKHGGAAPHISERDAAALPKLIGKIN